VPVFEGVLEKAEKTCKTVEWEEEAPLPPCTSSETSAVEFVNHSYVYYKYGGRGKWHVIGWRALPLVLVGAANTCQMIGSW